MSTRTSIVTMFRPRFQPLSVSPHFRWNIALKTSQIFVEEVCFWLTMSFWSFMMAKIYILKDVLRFWYNSVNGVQQERYWLAKRLLRHYPEKIAACSQNSSTWTVVNAPNSYFVVLRFPVRGTPIEQKNLLEVSCLFWMCNIIILETKNGMEAFTTRVELFWENAAIFPV